MVVDAVTLDVVEKLQPVPVQIGPSTTFRASRRCSTWGRYVVRRRPLSKLDWGRPTWQDPGRRQLWGLRCRSLGSCDRQQQRQATSSLNQRRCTQLPIAHYWSPPFLPPDDSSSTNNTSHIQFGPVEHSRHQPTWSVAAVTGSRWQPFKLTNASLLPPAQTGRSTSRSMPTMRSRRRRSHLSPMSAYPTTTCD